MVKCKECGEEVPVGFVDKKTGICVYCQELIADQEADDLRHVRGPRD